MQNLIVIGGGAAGFFCGINAARLHPNLQVTILEKSSKLLSKVRISGGGRCNVTHNCSSVSELIKKYPRGGSFVKKTFSQFNHIHTRQWFEERGVQLKTESDGRIFPVSDSSQSIIDCLMAEANKYKLQIHMNADVKELVQTSDQTGFDVCLQNGKRYHADYVCVACGGFPKAEQFGWLQKTGHAIVSPVPSLFTFNMPKDPITELMGISFDRIQVKIPSMGLKQEGPLLITHWGLSGPSIITLSAWGATKMHEIEYEFEAWVNWLPDYHETSLREGLQQKRHEMAGQKIFNRNPFGLPERFWKYQMEQVGIGPDTRWADLSAMHQNKLAKQLTGQVFKIKGKTTFKDEFVTAGGISLNEINPHSMESKLVPGLFFAGEIIDVDGVTGGFNFQHAWTSGWIAAHLGKQPSKA